MFQRIRYRTAGVPGRTEYLGAGDAFRLTTYGSRANPVIDTRTGRGNQVISRRQAAELLITLRAQADAMRNGYHVYRNAPLPA